MGKKGDRFSDDKIIDITDYVNNRQTDDEIAVENVTSSFISMINQSLIDRQKKEAKERFIYFMINFLLLSQFISAIAIAIILVKLYP
jgi:hypothetical protein